MNTRELMDHIRSGPAELELDEPLRFRRRTRSSPCDFNDFLEALEANETIRSVECASREELDISEDQWFRLVKSLGSIKGIEELKLQCVSRNLDPFQTVADAVNNAQSLRKLDMDVEGETLYRDPSGLAALANALQVHSVLEEFTWFDFESRLEPAAAQNTALDPLLQALSACLQLQKVTIMTDNGSVDAVKNLLHLYNMNAETELHLVLLTKHWFAVVDEIGQGCEIWKLTLTLLEDTRSKATEAIKAVASAIQLDRNLVELTLEIKNGFTDEEGVALAEALTVNTTLNLVVLAIYSPSDEMSNAAILGAPAYKAFAAMLRINTNLFLELPEFETAGSDERLLDLESWKHMHIEQRLNEVGRKRLLASKHPTKAEWVLAREITKEDWVNAFYELSSHDDENDDDDDEPAELRLSCLFSLLLLNPSVVCMP
jgi:hypothetical protein